MGDAGVVTTNDEALAKEIRSLANYGSAKNMCSISQVAIAIWTKYSEVTDWNQHVFHIFTVLYEQRDELLKYLESKGIGTNIHYPIPPHKQECYKGWNDLNLPVTEKFHTQELSLPMSPCLTNELLQWVIECINKCC